MCCGVFKEGRQKGQIDEIAAAAKEEEEEEEEELHGWWLRAWPKEEGIAQIHYQQTVPKTSSQCSHQLQTP
jgi:hypothetical protein